jgi:phosphoribosylglycinamide formyltransferase-1
MEGPFGVQSPRKIGIAALASGRGSDFQCIVDAIEAGKVNGRMLLLITDNPDAMAIQRAEKHGIPWVCIQRKDFPGRVEHDRAIRAKLDEVKPDLVTLVGYMRIIKDAQFLSGYFGRMINIHPSLLPSFPGAHAQADAFRAGAKVSGYTIHFVDRDPAALDGGPMIWQEAVDISGCKDADEAAARILEREHAGLPLVVDSFSKGRYWIDGKRVRYEKA